VQALVAARGISVADAMSIVEGEEPGAGERFNRDEEARRLREASAESARDRVTLDDVESWVHEFRTSPPLQQEFGFACNYLAYMRAVRRGRRRAADEDPQIAVCSHVLYTQELAWHEEFKCNYRLREQYESVEAYLGAKRRATAASRAAALQSAAVPPSPSTVRAAPAAPEPVITATFPTTSRFTTRVGQENETDGEEKVTPNTFRLGTGWRFDPATCIWMEYIVKE
jgi:hypothetical protein